MLSVSSSLRTWPRFDSPRTSSKTSRFSLGEERWVTTLATSAGCMRPSILAKLVMAPRRSRRCTDRSTMSDLVWPRSAWSRNESRSRSLSPGRGFGSTGRVSVTFSTGCITYLLIAELAERMLVFTPGLPHFHPQLQKHLHAEHALHIKPRFGPDRFQPFSVFADRN